jgi:hypothetical protein
VTGRIPLLPLAEQENLYNLIEQEYRAYVEQREALGESVLEASTLNLDAKIMARMEILPADEHSTSPFTGAVFVELVDAKTPRKPYPALAVINQVRGQFDLKAVDDKSHHDPAQVQRLATDWTTAQTTSLQEQTQRYKLTQPQARGGAIALQEQQVAQILKDFPIGRSVSLTTAKGDTLYGVVAAAGYVGNDKENPAAPSSWNMRVLVADAAQVINLPFSQLNSDKNNGVQVRAADQDDQGNAIIDLFEQRQTHNREQRQIITGNLLRGYAKYPGSVVNFSDCHGNMRQGLLTPRGFDAEKFLQKVPVVLPTIEDAWRWIADYHGQLQTSDLCLTIKEHKQGDYVLHTPKPKGEGGRYYLDDKLLEAAGGEFFSVADRMECRVDASQLEAVLTYLLGDRNIRLVANERQDEVREMLGIVLPTLEPIPDIPLAALPPAASPAASAPPPASATPILPVLPQEPKFSASSPAESSARSVGKAEQNIVRLFEQGQLTSKRVREGEDFYLKVENEPYIPLMIERHDDRLYLTHYLEQNGDLYIDSEMVFSIRGQGALTLAETAVHGLGMEHRGCDKEFAAIFSRNLIEQGFGRAIYTALQAQPEPQEEEEDLEAEVFEQPSLLSPDTLPVAQEDQEPPLTHDPYWDTLDTQRRAANRQETAQPTLTVEEVWAWKRAARDLQLGKEREQQIRELEAKLKERSPLPVTPEIATAIATDLERYRPFEERGKQLLAYAQVMLANAGQLDIYGKTTFRGKNYELVQSGDSLTITHRTAKKNEVILQTKGDAVLRSTVRKEDVERFGAVVQPYVVQQQLSFGFSIA